MRPAAFSLVAVLAFALPAAALARQDGDGTLSVSRMTGAVTISVSKGSVLGRVDRGKLVVEDTDPNDGISPIVYGADKVARINDATLSYSGTNMRFRFVGGSFKLRLAGAGIDVSAVGRGFATLGPDPSTDAPPLGTFSYNGSSDTLMPTTTTRFALGSS
jgi:hypothetical protein